MATEAFFRRYALVQEASALMRGAGTLDETLEILRAKARAILAADGVAVIRREEDRVVYVGEDAISPLWTGQSFPIEQCISGMAMLERRPILLPDIKTDARVPHGVYLATFVKSMAMFPLGSPTPIAALGAYWQEERTVTPDIEALMGFLAQAANGAFERLAIDEERASGRTPRAA